MEGSNSNVLPGNDFNQFVNSVWMKNNPIPNDYNRWGSFEELMEITEDRLKKILENESDNSDHLKLKHLYSLGMDQEKLNQQKIISIEPYLKQIDQMTNVNDFSKYISLMILSQLSTPFYLSVHADAKDSNTNVIYLYQGGLGLSDRDYYFHQGKDKERKGYVEYLSKISKMVNLDVDPKIIYDIEEAFADISLTKVERREPEKIYNVFDLGSLQELVPNFNWSNFFDELNVEPKKIIVDNPKFFEKFNNMLNDYKLEDWKNYFKIHLVRNAAPYLSDEFYQVNFDFYNKMLKGQIEPKPRWKRVLSTVESLLGEIIGKIYVSQYFSEQAKVRALDMVNKLKDELRRRIKLLDWMNPITKDKAIDKLNKFRVKIGYPNNWRDYSNLNLDSNTYFGNIILASQFDMKYDLSYAYKPVDKEKWEMHPHQINAYYHPLLNEIVFPAGILQKPFFSHEYDDALNYGGIGAVIGHEMTHGFDDKGRKFDAEGNMKDWWTQEDAEKYTKKANVIKDQFSEYVIEGEKVNGELTLGENIADLGGMTIAYHALQEALKNKSVGKIDGYTQDQRFFLSWATVWRNNIRKEEALNRLIMDPHSPGSLRINGVVTNMKPFYQAFNVLEGQALHKSDEQIASVW
jgi:putative endopeptidase